MLAANRFLTSFEKKMHEPKTLDFFGTETTKSVITEFYYRWSKVRRHLRRLLSIAVVNSKDWNPNWEHLNSIKIHGYPYCSNKWKDKSCTHTCSNVTDRQRKTLKIIWHWSKLCCFVFLSLMGEYLENNIPACKKSVGQWFTLPAV